METPPSPAGRAIGGVIIAIFCLALIWAGFGTVDIVATAQGKIVSRGRTKIVQPFETGVIRAIHVHDGQRGREDRPAGTDCKRRAALTPDPLLEISRHRPI